MKLETERLCVIPLLPEQLEQLVDNISEFERDLQCSYQGQKIEGLFQSILSGQVQKAKDDRDNYVWHSFWIMVKKAGRVIVGTVDFKNVPDEKGEVEIGYGLGEKHEHKGYMTEAIQAMCGWAKKQARVKHIIAETESGNLPSERVLLRCGFAEYFRGSTAWWRL